MPELPEVETMVRGIRPYVEGRRLIAARRAPCHCRPISVRPGPGKIRQRTHGRLICCVERIAKRVLLRLETGDAFVIEPRMTGLMLVSDPPDPDHLRYEWLLEPTAGRTRRRTAQSLWFWDRRGLGTVRLMTPRDQEELLGPAKLGTDALSITPHELADQLGRTRRAIKVALLDQKLVSGIGNLYASEMLHLAGIHPEQASQLLRTAQIRRLHEAMLCVLETAIRYEGSTLSDGTYRNALNENGSYQNEHRVYAREGETCPSCGRGRIRRIVQAQRATFYCPCCQRRRSS